MSPHEAGSEVFTRKIKLTKANYCQSDQTCRVKKLRHAFDNGFFTTLDSTVTSAESLKETIRGGKLSPKYCKLNVLLYNEMAALDQFVADDYHKMYAACDLCI